MLGHLRDSKSADVFLLHIQPCLSAGDPLPQGHSRPSYPRAANSHCHSVGSEYTQSEPTQLVSHWQYLMAPHQVAWSTGISCLSASAPHRLCVFRMLHDAYPRSSHFQTTMSASSAHCFAYSLFKKSQYCATVTRFLLIWKD
jgi:hypothetical protein